METHSWVLPGPGRSLSKIADNCGELGKEHSSQITESHYIDASEGLAHLEDAIFRLKNGDKLVFKYDVNGQFSLADRPRSYWGNYLIRIEWREHPAIEEVSTPGANRFLDTFDDLSQAWGACSDILESKWLDDAAPYSFGNWLGPTRQYAFPQSSRRCTDSEGPSAYLDRTCHSLFWHMGAC
ncbi:Imm71 family immunity protein [Cupriavidus necator]|uniref:Imm71 family immunity protein n=1 Tax=Cupriavidus necator TaxID=106590 RepID=UPI00148FA35E